MRVISLLPAATEIVAALGAGGRLVGVTHECDYPPDVRTLPRVTRARVDPELPSGEIDRAVADAKRTGVAALEVDVPLIARLRPDVIIGQSVCDVCAVGHVEIVEKLAFRDYLRAHPRRAAEYGALKQDLARRYRRDNIGYMHGKDAFIRTLLKDARQWSRGVAGSSDV